MKKTMKKAGKALLIGCLALLLLPVSALLLAPVIDNMALRRYESEILRDLRLPPDSAVVETVSTCGNTGGTGNHTDLYVGVLVETALSEEAWRLAAPTLHPSLAEGLETETMRCVGASFSASQIVGRVCVLEFVKAAPCSAFDLRGH